MTATYHPSPFFQPSPTFRRVAHHVDRAGEASHGSRPNYLARRVLVAVTASAVLAAGAVGVDQAVGALTDLGGRPAAASEVAPTADAPTQHVAVAGDTMWSIAGHYRGDVGRDRYIDALVDLNGGASVQVGQAIRLP